MSYHRFEVDFAAPAGRVNLFNNMNKLPVGNKLVVPESFKKLRPPMIRLHDVPFDTHGSVDTNYLFPLFHADENDPYNYRFEKTDDLIRSLQEMGSRAYFRLGASIEHSSSHYDVHPPPDVDKWARICVKIIDHYRRGWANGHQWPIEYWEIWNEPDVRPSCWTGTHEQYFDLYVAAAKAIKQAHPDVKVGGPATYSPYHREFLGPFLDRLKKENAPLDFFSWHRYSNDPVGLKNAAQAADDLLKEYGFENVENHCNEWNYFPSPDCWAIINNPNTPELANQVFDEMSGMKGTAFCAATIIIAQDSPIDVAMFYSGDSTRFGLFAGLFSRGIPQKNYHVFEAMTHFEPARERVKVAGNADEQGLALLAAKAADGKAAVLLLANFAGDAAGADIDLNNPPWQGPVTARIHRLDEGHSLECTETVRADHNQPLRIDHIAAPSVCLVALTAD